MYVVLPEEGGVRSALQALAQEGMAYFADMEYGPDVRLTLPKFSLTYGGSLLDGLRARGMTLSASLDADFSAMCADVPLYISDVLQNVRVDVDEEGTRAAAVTALFLAGASMPLEEPEFVEMTVDRPFLFVIADEESGAIALCRGCGDGIAPQTARGANGRPRPFCSHRRLWRAGPPGKAPRAPFRCKQGAPRAGHGGENQTAEHAKEPLPEGSGSGC